MARTTTGGHVPVGGRRRPCRRLLPLLLVLAALVLAPASLTASTSADDWISARMVHRTHALAIGEAAQRLADGTTEREVRDLRRVVARAVRAIDRLEVHACYQVWWSYVRSSFVLFDQALVGLESGDPARTQSSVQASRFLATMAAATSVDCPRDAGSATALQPSPSQPIPLAERPTIDLG